MPGRSSVVIYVKWLAQRSISRVSSKSAHLASAESGDGWEVDGNVIRYIRGNIPRAIVFSRSKEA
jgi:hypothetical protein